MDFKDLISKLDTISSKKILLESESPILEGEETWAQRVIDEDQSNLSMAKELIESFGYIAEASPEELIRQQPAMSYAANKLGGADAGATNSNPTGYDPNKVQYAYQDGKANPDWPGNKPPADQKDKPADDKKPDQPKKKPARVMNPGAKAFQHFLNSQGFKVKADGKMGPETKTAGDTHYTKLAAEIKAASDAYIKTMNDADKVKRDQLGKLMDQHIRLQGLSYADVVGNRPGNAYIGSPEFIQTMKQYGYDPKTGDPVGGAKSAPAAADGKAGAADVKSGQGTQPTNTNAASASAAASTGALPKELDSADKKEPYWVSGTRYEFTKDWDQQQQQWVQRWKATHRPGEAAFNANTRAAGNLGYTGPQSSLVQGIAKLDREKNLAAQQPPAQGSSIPGSGGAINKESLDDIRFLSGLK